jgi:hypothetical protein
LNHYPFLEPLRSGIVTQIRELFDRKLRFSFPEDSFVFDVYIPEADADDDDQGKRGLGRARLIDINPWAPKTDTLLFDWQELLALKVARPLLGGVGDQGSDAEGLVETESDTTDEEEQDYEPELRIVEEDDPTAYNFSSPQYSAHKLPKEVVDASLAGHGGLRDFARRWRRVLSGEERPEDWETSDGEPDP